MVSWEFPPLVVGGLGRHVGELAARLAELGHDVRVLTRGSAEHPVDELVGGVRVCRAALDPLAIDLASESVLAWTQAFEHSLVRSGLRLLDGWQPEVIHAHDWLVAQTAHTLAGLGGAPLVVTMHATEHGRQQGWLSSPVQQAIHSVERWLCRDAAAVLVCSQFMAEQVATLFDLDPARVAVVGNGAALPRPTAEDLAAATARYRTSGPLLAFAGRLVHEKGLQELIKALPLLETEFPDVRLVVAGTGPDLAGQQDRAERYRVAGRVSWPGFLDGRQLAALFAVADAVVVPSLYEPFGLVAVEAQLAGTPVAVCDTGGLSELVEPGRTGLRFTAQNPAAIAGAVGRLLRDPGAAAELAVRAERQARERFSWAAVAARTVQGYQRAVAGDPPGRAASRPSRPAAAG